MWIVNVFFYLETFLKSIKRLFGRFHGRFVNLGFAKKRKRKGGKIDYFHGKFVNHEIVCFAAKKKRFVALMEDSWIYSIMQKIENWSIQTTLRCNWSVAVVISMKLHLIFKKKQFGFGCFHGKFVKLGFTENGKKNVDRFHIKFFKMGFTENVKKNVDWFHGKILGMHDVQGKIVRSRWFHEKFVMIYIIKCEKNSWNQFVHILLL